jgi:hypothetical protein
MAEMNYLKQVVAHSAARLAVGQMPLDFYLLAQFKQPVNII